MKSFGLIKTAGFKTPSYTSSSCVEWGRTRGRRIQEVLALPTTKDSILDGFWDQHYRSFSEDEPSPFCKDVLGEALGASDVLVELGCGNGRDGAWIAQRCSHYIGLDNSASAIEASERRFRRLALPPSAFQLAVSDFSAFDFSMAPKGNLIVYSRFSLHSDTEQAEDSLLGRLAEVVDRPLSVFIEVRTIYDELFGSGQQVGRNAFVTDHYRRFVDPSELRAKLERDFRLDSFTISRGYAPYRHEDPQVLRVRFGNQVPQ